VSIQAAATTGWFEQFARDYVQLRHYPDRFQRMIRRGQRFDNVTHPGWPDGLSRRADGRIDAVEATFSDDWASVKRHLQNDLAKIKTRRDLASFCLVTWCADPGDTEWIEQHNAFVTAGLPSEAVELVFRNELVEDLANPRYARLWVQHLGLSGSPEPLVPIEQAGARIFGKNDAPSDFAPSELEYQAENVWLPRVAEELRRRLDEIGWAFVVGPPNSGKTVLATALGLERALPLGDTPGARRPALYLDLSRTPDLARAKDAMAAYADSQTLLIVDNVHRDEEGAAETLEYWRSLHTPGPLLMLGREIRSGLRADGLRGPLDEQSQDAIRMQVTGADVAGVYERLRRRPGLADQLPKVDEKACDAWADTFAGDLLAFGAAVAYSAQSGKSIHELSPTDAALQIWTVYVEGLDADEVEELRIVSALEALELDTPSAVLRPRALRRSLTRGTVHAFTDTAPTESYRLSPPGTGDLILTALGDHAAELNALELAARKDPVLGLLICARSRRSRRHSVEPRILGTLASTPELLARTAYLYPHGLHRLVTRLEKLGVARPAELDEQLAAAIPNVIQELAAAVGPLGKLVATGDKVVPRTREVVLDALSDPGSWRMLRSAMGKIRMEHLAELLRLLRHFAPPAHAALVRVLQDVDTAPVARDVPTLRRNKLSGVAQCFDVFGSDCPRLAHAMETSLLQAVPMLVTALEMSPHETARFLSATTTSAPELTRSVRRRLTNEETLDRLAESALRSPLQQLISCLGAAREGFQDLHDAILTRLEATEPHALSHRFCAIGLPAIPRAINYLESVAPDLSRSVLADLESEPAASLLLVDWLGVRGARRSVKLRQFVREKLPVISAQLERISYDDLDSMARYALQGSLEVRLRALRVLRRDPEVSPHIWLGLKAQVKDHSLAHNVAQSDPSKALPLILFFSSHFGHVGKTLIAQLDHHHRRQIVRSLRRKASVPELAHYLTKIKDVLPRTHESALQRLAGAAGQDRLGSWVETEFLAEIARLCSSSGGGIGTAIAGGSAGDRLAHRLSTCEIASVNDFLIPTDFVGRIVERIPKTLWDESRLSGAPPPEVVPELCRRLDRCGRPELGEAVSRRLITTAKGSWAQSGASAAETGHVLRLAREAPSAERIEFLKANGGTSWLRARYREAPIDELAGHFYGLWEHQDEPVLSLVRGTGATEIVEGRLREVVRGRRVLGRVRLLGSATLLGIASERPPEDWPDSRALRHHVSAARPTKRGFLWTHATLLVGLRELARYYAGPLEIAPETGYALRQALEQRYAKTLTDDEFQPSVQRTHLLESLRVWMDDCEQQEWRFMGGEESIAHLSAQLVETEKLP